MSERDYWTFFIGEARRANAPLYVRLAEGIAGDAELRALAESVPPGQPPANVLLAAVHFLLLKGAHHPLRAFYPNLGGTSAATGPFPDFKDFVGAHRDEIAELVSSRIANTNEVGRSAILHAGFRVLAKKAGAPLHLVEIGPSAGLNMIWDRYRICYGRDGESFETDARDAELTIHTALRGKNIPPLGPSPRVASRLGLEKNPVDLDDADERTWLSALVWPDHVARFARLESAMSLYVREKPEIWAGDALDLLPAALARAPQDETLCTYHTVVAYQLTRDMRKAVDDMLVVASLRRPVWRLALEFAGDGQYPLQLSCYEDGIKREEELALCDPHGAWIEWRG